MNYRLFVLAFAVAGLFAFRAPAQDIVDVDATTLGLPDATPVNMISNSGSAGNFSAIIGMPVTASQPANNNPGVMIQGLDFSGQKMKSAVSSAGVGITGNVPYSIKAWVWNPAIGSEEAIVSWGRRGGPDGSNMGFHQGNNGSFGAVGHWGGPDIGYGNGGADINATAGRWAQLAYVYDGAQGQSVYIDGVLNNSDVTGVNLNPHQNFNDATPIHLYLGSESDAANENSTPIAFSGIIADVEVFSSVLSDQDIAASFAAESPFFFDGIQSPTNQIPEPGSLAIFAIVGLVGLGIFTWRKRRGCA